METSKFANGPDYFNIRYEDYPVHRWLWNEAPCRWRGRVNVRFRYVRFASLQRGASRTNRNVVEIYVQTLASGRAIAPPVVSLTNVGAYFVHDGNHRHEAIRQYLGTAAQQTWVRVAVTVPAPGFHLQWRWLGDFGTYVLEPDALFRFRPSSRSGIDERLLALVRGKTLIFAAHPDDELGCSALLQRMNEPIVVFATFGAPRDDFFWSPYGSREAYAWARRQEAEKGLSAIGVKALHFLEDHSVRRRDFADQQLHECIAPAVTRLEWLIARYKPTAILVPAYEGGHPDHDTCSFIGAALAQSTGTPIWEMPLYHRAENGQVIYQQFRDALGDEVAIPLSYEERLNRSALISTYASQVDLGRYVSAPQEYVRNQRKYDYNKPPHVGLTNYERWGWKICPEDVCTRFRDFGFSIATENAFLCAPDQSGREAQGAL